MPRQAGCSPLTSPQGILAGDLLEVSARSGGRACVRERSFVEEVDCV